MKKILMGFIIGLVLGTGILYGINNPQIINLQSQVIALQDYSQARDDEITILQNQLDSLKEQIVRAQSQVIALQDYSQARDDEITILQNQLDSLKEQIDIQNITIRLLKQQIYGSQKNLQPVIILIIDPLISNGIADNLAQFISDLNINGYNVIPIIEKYNTPFDVRDILIKTYNNTNKQLIGAILIGQIPYAYQYVVSKSTNPSIPDDLIECISFQYYADLDGIFSASIDYKSPGNHNYSYNIHSGNTDWEIWVGVLPYYKGDLNMTIDALNRYFVKNHAFRTGKYNMQNRFLEIDEHYTANSVEESNFYFDSLRNGQYSWTPFSNSTNSMLYFNSPPIGLSVDQGYEILHHSFADFTVVDVHGTRDASGKLTIKTIEEKSVNTAFFWDNGCSTGNIDYSDNFLCSIIYSPTSLVVVAKGTTNHSGGLGTNSNGFFGHNIATVLSKNNSFGQALLNHINVPLLKPWADSREFYFASSIIMGDPTLCILPGS